jgi:hypothetical protein
MRRAARIPRTNGTYETGAEKAGDHRNTQSVSAVPGATSWWKSPRLFARLSRSGWSFTAGAEVEPAQNQQMRVVLLSITCVFISCAPGTVVPTPPPTATTSVSVSPLTLVGPCAVPTLSPPAVVEEFFEMLDAARLPEMATCWVDAPDRLALMREYASTGGTTARFIGTETTMTDGAVAVEVRVDWRNTHALGAWESGQTKWLILRRQPDGRWAIESTWTALPRAPEV